MSNPLISVIIVNWNGKKWLKKCLDSLESQTFINFEVVLVDNASKDESVEYAEKYYPKVRVIKSRKNIGFAGGNNLGIEASKGKLIFLLNNDTWIDKDFLDRLHSFYIRSSFDVVAPQEAFYDGLKRKAKYNTMIDVLGHPVELYNTEKCSPFYLSGVAILFSKELYQSTGGLDNDFFMYFEEIDWFWRLHLMGKKIGYAPDVYVYHAGAGSTGGGIKYNAFLWRNQNTLQMLLKNYKMVTLLAVLPLYIFINAIEMFFFLLLGRVSIAYSYYGGWKFNVIHISRTLEKRKSIQKSRSRSDIEILRMMYFGFAKVNHLITYYGK